MSSTVNNSPNISAAATRPAADFGVRYSLGELFALFILLSFVLFVCTVAPLLTIIWVPITIAIIRTTLLVTQRRRLGQTTSPGDCLELFAGTVVMTFTCVMSLGLAGLMGFSFGSALQFVFASERGEYLLGGITGAIVVASLMAVGWWPAIQSNWVYDLQLSSRAQRNAAQAFSTNEKLRRFRFDLTALFELTTTAAVLALLSTWSFWLPVVLAPPMLVAIMANARRVERLRRQDQFVSFADRCAMLAGAFVVAVVVLSTTIAACVGGILLFSLVGAEMTGNRVVVLILFGGLGGLIFGGLVATIWIYGLRRVTREQDTTGGK